MGSCTAAHEKQWSFLAEGWFVPVHTLRPCHACNAVLFTDILGCLFQGEEESGTGGRKEISLRAGAGSEESQVTRGAGRGGQQCLGYSVMGVREEEFCLVETLMYSTAISTIIFSLVKDGAGQESFFARMSTYILQCN